MPVALYMDVHKAYLNDVCESMLMAVSHTRDATDRFMGKDRHGQIE